VVVGGGEWLRVEVRFGSSCARAPRLISVLDSWGVGDMMVMGCCSRWGSVAAAQSLEAVHQVVSAATCRELAATYLCEGGLSRAASWSCGLQGFLAEFAQRVVAA